MIVASAVAAQQLPAAASLQQHSENAPSTGATSNANTAQHAARFAKRRRDWDGIIGNRDQRYQLNSLAKQPLVLGMTVRL